MKRLNLALIMALNSFICFAGVQPPPPNGTDDPINAPIDTNLYILFIVGLLYAGYKTGVFKHIQIILYKKLLCNNIIYYFCNRKP